MFVCTVDTTGHNLHTFLGMVGYCSKDAGKEHFRCIVKGVTKQDRLRGAALYLRMGASQIMKSKTELTPTNFIERALVFKQKCGRPTDSLKLPLYKMLYSGKYYPSPLWVVNNTGAPLMLTSIRHRVRDSLGRTFWKTTERVRTLCMSIRFHRHRFS